MVVANMRGDQPEDVYRKMADEPPLSGLRGPTIAPVFTQSDNGQRWYSISIVVQRARLNETIGALRSRCLGPTLEGLARQLGCQCRIARQCVLDTSHNIAVIGGIEHWFRFTAGFETRDQRSGCPPIIRVLDQCLRELGQHRLIGQVEPA